MKFREMKRKRWSFDRDYKGTKNKITVIVHYSQYREFWYFTEQTEGRPPYNSLWYDLSYNSQEECEIAAEKYCDAI